MPVVRPPLTKTYENSNPCYDGTRRRGAAKKIGVQEALADPGRAGIGGRPDFLRHEPHRARAPQHSRRAVCRVGNLRSMSPGNRPGLQDG